MSDLFSIETLDEDLGAYKPMLSAAADTILDQNVSEYPIFILYQEADVDIGILLSDHKETVGDWSVNASTLEEFVARQVIDLDKLEEFKKVYKDPQVHICIFVVNEIGATFVFIPRN